MFERRRPPLPPESRVASPWPTTRKAVYREIGKDLVVDEKAEGGGTDAAFAALKTKNAVVERFGLRGYGAHTPMTSTILLASIEPRLYLAARMIMDISQGKVK